MENYIVSARKYRPATFDSVIGQRALTTTLKNAIVSGKLAHAYLFCGPRGVGKTTCARIFAKAINCQHPTSDGEACNQCESCMSFNEQRSYNIFELDAASNNSVEDIRSLIEEVRIPPQIGKYKVYIIDEVHMLSAAAFNAFLKTLEEPPKHAVFILATTEKQKLLPTILSRCQIYDFSRISVQDIVEHLQYVAKKEDVQAEPEALMVIAQKADGGMRDALSIFDQVVSFTQGNITYKSTIDNLNVLDYEYYFHLTDMFLSNKVSDALLLYNSVLQKGFDGNHFITGLASHFRDLLVSKDPATLSLLEVSNSVQERYREQARKCSSKFLFQAIKRCNDCDLNYRVSRNKRLLVELTLIECAQLTFADMNEVSDEDAPRQQLKPVFQQQTSPKVGSQQMIQPQQPRSTQSQPVQTVHTNPLPEEKNKDTEIPTIKKLSDLSVSIKQKKQDQSETINTLSSVKNTTEVNKTIDEPINLATLDLAWREFASSLPLEQKANSLKMMAIHPQLIDESTFEITIDNRMAANSMQKLTGDIEKFLQKRLHNNKIKMTIHLNETTESNRPYTTTEKLQLMLKKNPHLKELKETLGLELI